MKLVYYSIACMAGSRCQLQWVQSIRSLRRHNRETPVWLFVYDVPEPFVLEEARRSHVELRALGPYAAHFGHLPAPQAEALARCPTLHKVLSLRHCPLEQAEQVLCIDCDTFFFDDVTKLFKRYAALHWYAREEPYSSRSAAGYDADYVNEATLAQIARYECAVPVAPYNSGAFMMNHGVWYPLCERADEFLRFVWRLLVGQCRWPRSYESANDALLNLVREHCSSADWHAALPFPSRNAWIVEEVALWLTLGRIPGLAHGVFDATDVAQGGECIAPQRAVMAHYYSGGEHAFFARVAPL